MPQPLAVVATLALHYIEVRVVGARLEPRGVGAFQDYRGDKPKTTIGDWSDGAPPTVRQALQRLAGARRSGRRATPADVETVRHWAEAVLAIPKPVSRIGRRLDALARAGLARRLA